jgi:hypothetical protein
MGHRKSDYARTLAMTRTASIHSVADQISLNADPTVSDRFDTFFFTASPAEIDRAAASAMALRDRIKSCTNSMADIS